MKKFIMLALLAFALIATPAFAGSYESNFNQIVLTEVGGEEAYVLFEASDQTDIAKIAASDADANAECLIIDLEDVGTTIVPVVLLTLADTDFGYFDGYDQPTLAIEDEAGTSWISLGFASNGNPELAVGGVATGMTYPAGISGWTATDDQVWGFGTGTVAGMLWATDDANANLLAVDLPAQAGADVPVFLLTDTVADDGWYDGIAEPTLAINNLAATGYVSLSFSGTTIAQLATGQAATALNIISPIVNINASTAYPINLGAGTATGTITLGGTGTQAINIGTGAGIKTVTLGSATTTSATAIDSGTGDMVITSVDDLSILGGSAGSIINIGTNVDGNAINVGTNDTAADTIAVGSAKDTVTIDGIAVDVGSTGTTSALTLQSGTGDITMTSTDDFTATASGAVALFSNAIAQTVTFGNATGASSMAILAGSGDMSITSADDWTATASGAVALFSNAVAQTITLGNATGASSLDLLAGTGNFTLNGVAATTYTFGNAAQTGTMSFGESSATTILNLGTGVGAHTIHIGDGGTAAQVITIGSDSVASSLALDAGTGNMTLGGAVATTITIGETAQTGTIGVGVSSATMALNLGTGTGAHTVSIANGAGVQTVTIGSTNTTSATTIQAGSGSITMTGDVDVTGDVAVTGSLSSTVPMNYDALLSSTAVDVEAVATTALYVVPTGKSCIITKIVIRSAGQTLDQGTDAVSNIGFATATDLVASGDLSKVLTGTSTWDLLTLATPGVMGTTTQTLNWHNTTGTTGTGTLVCDVFGYLF